MKQFIRRCLLFILPVLGLFLTIFFVDVPRFYNYHYTNNDGCYITWIYNRIYENPRPIEVAFLGTSHTGCSVNDKLIDSLIPGINCANMAYCQYGINIQYVVLKDILRKHKLKKVFLELREEEDYSSHRNFGTVAELEDVLAAPFIGNFKFFDGLFKAYQVRYMYFQDRLFGSLPKNSTTENKIDFIISGLSNEHISKEIAEDHIAKQTIRLEKQIKNPLRNFKLKYPYHYFDKIAELAKAHNVELNFIYIPSYGMVSEKPNNFDFVSRYGKVYFPPLSLFKDHEIWKDHEHFNTIGSEKFSIWLAGELKTKD